MDDNTETKEKGSTPITRGAKTINLYAAAGIAILVTALAGLIALSAAFVAASNGNDTSYYNDAAPIMSLVASFVIIVLGLGLPTLLGAKFGWRTVVMTIIIEALLVFIITSGFVLFAGSLASDQPKAIYAEPAINE